VTAHDPPPPHQVIPKVPVPLSDLILRLLAKDPAARPQSAQEVVAALGALPGADSAEGCSDRVTGGEAGSSAPTVEEPGANRQGVEPEPAPRPGRGRRVAFLATAVVAAGLVAAIIGWAVWQRPWHRTPPPNSHDGNRGVVNSPLGLQLRLSARKKGQDRLKSLDEQDVLPLRAGDALCIEARTARPAYFYVLNPTADGRVWLMYPWRNDRDWDSIAAEKPRDFYRVPDPSEGVASKLDAGPSGIESVVVLARETPLTAAEREQLRELLKTWPVDQGKFDPLRAAVMIGEDEFHFGDPRDEKDRGKVKAGDAVESNDPVLRLRRLLQGDVRSLGVASRGVCYTFKGE
jgi:hypothetical protein